MLIKINCHEMESKIAVVDQTADWEESEETLFEGNSELKRFSTLCDVVTYLLQFTLSNEDSFDLESIFDESMIDIIRILIVSLPSFSTPRDFFALLVDRFDIKCESSMTSSCREQKQLKLLTILDFWLSMQTATNDFSGSLADALSDFMSEVIARGSEIVSRAGENLKVCLKSLSFSQSKLIFIYFQRRVDIVKENSLNIENAHVIYMNRIASLLHHSVAGGGSDADEDPDDTNRSSTHSGHSGQHGCHGRALGRESDSSLASVSLCGENSE